MSHSQLSSMRSNLSSQSSWQRFYFAVAVCLCVFAASCGGLAVKTSDYEADFQYPKETDNFVLAKKEVFPSAWHGARLRYLDKKYTDDVLDLVVYPITDFAFENRTRVLNQELDNILNAVDKAVADGHKRFRGVEIRQPFKVQAHHQDFLVGLRSQFDLHGHDGRTYATFVYLFIQQDKFVRVRTVFDAELSPGWNGDKVVEELLPLIRVPAESSFMRKRRITAKKRFDQSLRRATAPQN